MSSDGSLHFDPVTTTDSDFHPRPTSISPDQKQIDQITHSKSPASGAYKYLLYTNIEHQNSPINAKNPPASRRVSERTAKFPLPESHSTPHSTRQTAHFVLSGL